MNRSRFICCLAILGVTLAVGGCGSSDKGSKSGSRTSTVTAGGAGDAQYSDPFGATKNGQNSKGATTTAARKRAAAALLLGKAAATKGGTLLAPAKPAVKAWAAHFKLSASAAQTDLAKYAAESGWTFDGERNFSRPK